MYNLFEDEDDVFTGSPKSKYFDVIFNANRGLSERELTRQLERMVAMEHFLEEAMGENFSERINRYVFENEEFINERIKTLYIEGMGNILSSNE